MVTAGCESPPAGFINERGAAEQMQTEHAHISRAAVSAEDPRSLANGPTPPLEQINRQGNEAPLTAGGWAYV